jgi:hypothetical protein
MKLQTQIKTAAALALSALAVAGPAAAGSPLDGYRDAHERGAAATSGEAAIAYFVANERSTLAQPSGEAAIKYFHENERASLAQSATTGALVGYVDGPERGAHPVGTTLVSQRTADDSLLDWGAAAVGASFALMLALLIGVSLVTARHFRSGPLPD